MRAIGPLLAFVTLGWLTLLFAAPVTALGVDLSAVTYAFAALVCHQRPERSFHLEAAQLPVCARCLGLYVGAGGGAAFAALKGCAGYSRWRASALRISILLSAMPTALTWSAEAAGLWSPSNTTRLIAALPLGAAVVVTVNYVGCAQPRQTGHTQPQIPI